MDRTRLCSILLARLDSHPQEQFPADFEDALPFVRQAAVNYLRHVWTDYDSRQNKAAGDSERQLDILCEVLNGIARIYPWLAVECQRQMDMKERLKERLEEETRAFRAYGGWREDGAW